MVTPSFDTQIVINRSLSTCIKLYISKFIIPICSCVQSKIREMSTNRTNDLFYHTRKFVQYSSLTSSIFMVCLFTTVIMVQCAG